MTAPDPAPILDLIEAFRRSKTMFAAAALGVFDALHEGAAPAAALAERLNTNADALERLLEACTGLGLLVKTERGFANTPASEMYLCRSSPQAIAGYVLHSNNALFPMWSHLEDAVREGTNRWEQTFGATGSLFSSGFFRTEESKRTFLMAMHGFGVMGSPAVVRAFDLSGFRRLVDLGGATGHLTIAACEAYSHLRGAVFDLPEVIAVAREQAARSPARDRIECVEGDFFRDPLPQADLFALGRILHDWAEEKIALLLLKIHRTLPDGGALLIAEKLLDDDRLGPVSAQMQSLNMLICTEGKERSLAEYRGLLTAAGFSEVQGVRTGMLVDAVLARK